MAKFRRVNSVPETNANLAFVSVPGAPASKIVDIIDPSGVSGIEHRRIMYGDVSGLLVDINGDPAIAASYPVVTDLFYDRDADRLLDANEVVPEAALPYRYRSQKTYIGNGEYQVSNPPTERVLVANIAASTIDDWDREIVLGSSNWTEIVTAVGNASDLVGKKIRVTASTWLLPNHTDANGTVIYDETPPDSPIGLYRTIESIDAGNKKLIYDTRFFEDNGNRPVDTETTGAGIIASCSFDLTQSIAGAAPMFSLTGSEGISLVDENGSEYSGRYIILLQRSGTEDEIVSEGTSSGFATHWVHVYLDRDDQELYLRFRSGILRDVDGSYHIGDIDIYHIERVDAVELFHYTTLDNVIDPVNEGQDLVASIPLNEQHGIYVTERAFVDKRVIDPLMWRIRGDIQRDTPIKTSLPYDELKIGVIGDVTTELKNFLNGDQSYDFRMKCVNPHSIGGSWVIDKTTAVWSDYDVVIYRGFSFEWSEIHKFAAGVINGGGIFIIDTASRDIKIDGGWLDDGRSSEYLVPKKLKIASTFTPFDPVATAITNLEIPEWLNDVVGGYTISENDIESIFPAISHSYINANIANYPKRRAFLKGTVSATERWFIAELSPGLIVSTIGITDINNEACKQIFCNLIWGYGAADPTRTISASSSTNTVYSPWETSWVAGCNVEGNPILSPAELETFGFRIIENEAGEKKIIRTLSNKTAEQLVKEHLVSTGNISIINGSSSISYTLELASCDNAFVNCIASITSSMKPEAWSERKNSPVFNVQDGYLIKNYLDNLTPGIIPSDTTDIISTVRVSGSLAKTEENDFTWSFSEGFSYQMMATSTKEDFITKDSGYIDFVTTWSDITWTAPNILRDHNVRSSNGNKTGNLNRYGTVTATKWYPWDGQSFLATLNHNHGPYVTYVQNALNALAEIGRGHRTGKLKVDGTYGRKTDAAVRDYQTRWNITADGDVDAGTAGHIMRNAGTVTGWKNLDDRWKTYGDMMNIVDGSKSTFSGRRTWINTRVNRMIDDINIYLKDGIKITGIQIEPYLLGSGAANFLHFYRIGGRRKSDHRKLDWAYNKSKNMKAAWKIRDNSIGKMSLTLPNELDMISIGLFQDNAYSGKAKMWGVKNVLPIGKISSSITVTKWDRHEYNTPLTILNVSHESDPTLITVTTSSPHGLTLGQSFYLSTSATKFVATKIVSSTMFNCVDANEEIIIGTIVKDLSVKIRTGERKMFIIKPTLPSGATFLGWDQTIETMIANINLSIVPISERTDVFTNIEMNATTGELYIYFYSPLESIDTECSIGKPFTIKMKPKDLYGIDNDYEDGIIGTASTAGGFSVIEDTTKFWAVNSISGRNIRFTSGTKNGIEAIVTSNTADTMILDQIVAGIASGDTYILTGGMCGVFSTSYTPTGSGSAVSVNVSTAGWNADALIGNLLIFTGATSNDKRVVRIIDNTSTNLTLKADGDTLISTTTGDTFKIISGHWPVFDNVEEDEAYTLTYSVDVLKSNGRVLGVFVVIDDNGDIVDVFEKITYTDILKFGLERIKIAVTNLHIVGDPSRGNIDKFPVRYAMKPFCVVEKTQGCVLDVNGLTGDQPDEVWGIKVEAGSLKRSIKVPPGLAISSTNGLAGFDNFVSNGVGKIIDCSYHVGNNAFSTTYGEPFVDVVKEHAEVIEYDALTKMGSVRILSTPIHEDINGNAIAEFFIDNTADVATINSVDRDSGVIYFTSLVSNFSPEVNMITVSYTFREQYVGYKGAGVIDGSYDIFDLCPYSGHITTVDSDIYDTVDLTGRPLYVYLLPSYSVCESETVSLTRSINHTLQGEMFDQSSPFYNPFAILLCVATIKGASDIVSTTVIDTRDGGGGLLKDNVDGYHNTAYTHESGFFEVDGFFDVGHMDGDGYLLGGTVIIELPAIWKTYWNQLGEDADAAADDFCSRWIAAGKTWHVIWVEEPIDPPT